MIDKILVFTGSRGEWGYLRPVLEQFDCQGLNYEIVVSNTHSDPNYGDTYKEIINDGFTVSEKLPMNFAFSSDFTWVHSLGALAAQVGGVLERIRPKFLLVAGDRAETTVFTTLAYYSDVIICHIQAGELSGHKDGMARHAIGKLAHVHFASNEDAVQRLHSLGEQGFRVHKTGAPQIDDLLSEEFQNSGRSVLQSLKIEKDQRFAVAIFHGSSDEQVEVAEYIERTNQIMQEFNLLQVWIRPNNDMGSSLIEDKIRSLPLENRRISRNLPRQQFAYLLANSSFLIGNSSCGILEAPSFGLPSINIGVRQKGRLLAESVHGVKVFNDDEIRDLIKMILSKGKLTPSFEYGDGKSSARITEILMNLNHNDSKLRNKYLSEADTDA